MTLVLEIEHLTGIAFSARGPASDQPDWPPQPDRIFSALVAACAARGERAEEAAALQWLEAQPVPRLLASDHAVRHAPISFVPPNDAQTGKSGDRKVMPAFRARQPRRFPAARPHDPILHLYWPGASPDTATLRALQGVARDTAYIGHSASLTRCHFRYAPAVDVPENAGWPRRRVYPGRFTELRQCFDNKQRPLRGFEVSPPPAMPAPLPASPFDERWLILDHVNGTMPDICAAALVAKAIRDTLMSGYNQIGLGDRVPAIVSGHQPDGAPLAGPHIAIVPLSFTGYLHADGHVLGYAIIPPRGSNLVADGDFRRALRKVTLWDEGKGRHLLRLRRFSLDFALAGEADGLRRSLDPQEYTRPSRTFATVTPIVLDRHLKQKGEERQKEIIDQIVAACRHVGLPAPDLVVPDRHSAVEGACSVPAPWVPATAPRWHLPGALAHRQLTHAVLRFPEKVTWPVILGAGRFAGLGLCRPLDSKKEQRR
ncbi:type I-U CRISPR-associated protein Csb2 [Asticcacaulis sp.]|uniref:type I-G CRISPR-associated protein Csb2 n=1 Tax=Asticcacaulis sp. TaxID=1872648 RepID=UPI0026064DEE|nr:type I-U CRISPR-associated protein Csb2 [Asticcacaulis sp.]